jgi:hypothetical protein
MFGYLYSNILFSEEQTHVKLIYITTDKLIGEFRINFLLPTNKLYKNEDCNAANNCIDF